MYLLGYDIGSSSVKASLVSVDSGKCVASSFFPKTEAENCPVGAAYLCCYPDRVCDHFSDLRRGHGRQWHGFRFYHSVCYRIVGYFV